MKRILVMAESAMAFNRMAQEKLLDAPHGRLNRSTCTLTIGDTRYNYASSEYAVKGMRDFGVERWGRWQMHPDWAAIDDELKILQTEHSK